MAPLEAFHMRRDIVAGWIMGLFLHKVVFASAGCVLVWGISTQALGGYFLGRVFRVRFCYGKSGISPCLISVLAPTFIGQNYHQCEEQSALFYSRL